MFVYSYIMVHRPTDHTAQVVSYIIFHDLSRLVQNTQPSQPIT